MSRYYTCTPMSKHRIVSGQPDEPNEERLNQSLRPTRIDDYVGQPMLIERLRITLQAVKERKEPMDHLLLHGPPGLGKPPSRTSSPMKWAPTSSSPPGPR